MENRPGPWGHESSSADSEDDSNESNLPKRSGELRLPRIPIPETRPAPNPVEARPTGIAAFFEQQRRAEEARLIAEKFAKDKETEDTDEDEPSVPEHRESAELVASPETADAAVPAAQEVTSREGHAAETTEAPAAEVGNSAIAAAETAPAEVPAFDFGGELQVPHAEAQAEVPVDAAALEQLQREAEAYANSLIGDEELPPAPVESTAEAPDEAASAELAELGFDAPTEAEEDNEADASNPGTVLLPRQYTRTGSAAVPSTPPPLMPMPGGGVSLRPRSPFAPAPGAAGGGTGAPTYGGGGGGLPTPGMGPAGANVIGAGAGLAGNLLHSHEHWHPKTFLALAGAILVSDMLGRSRDRKITRETRARSDQLKQIIEQNNARMAEQQTSMKHEAARVQESYDASRQKLASRLDQVEARTADTQPVQQHGPEAAAAPSEIAAPFAFAAAPERSSALRPERSVQAMSPAERLAAVPAGAFERQRDDTAGVAPETAPDTQRFAELHARPEMVLEQVARAAEVGASTERVYERRQEVRDEPGAGGQQGGGAAAQASMPFDFSGLQPQQAASRQLADTQAQLAQGQAYQRPDGTMYHNAMQAGFWAGVAIIVLGLIAVFVL